jgi:hypothetical protein
MKLYELTQEQVKTVIHLHKIRFREFFLNRKVYGLHDGERFLGMVAVSDNKQLHGAKKFFTPWVYQNDVNVAKLLLSCVIKAIKTEDTQAIIYSDCLTSSKAWFESCGFTFTSVKDGLKRYQSLWRGIYNG